MARNFILVQARLGSARFMEKVVAPFCGTSVINFLLQKLTELNYPIILCVPEDEKEKWKNYLKENEDYDIYFGSHEDVALRFLECCRTFKIDNAIRITADNPLTDTDLIPMIFQKLEKGFDYVSCKWDDGANIPKGLGCEGFKANTLEALYSKSNELEREHISEMFDRADVQRNIIKDPYLAYDIDLREGVFSIDHPLQLTILRKLLH